MKTSDRKIHIVLAGAGRMGGQHLEIFHKVKSVDLYGIYDPFIKAEKFGAKVNFISFDQVLSDQNVQAIIIAAPTANHAELVEKALFNHIHVLCEKPLTLDIEKHYYLGSLAIRNNLILQVGYWRRFAEPYQFIASTIRKGRIGKVQSIRASQWDAFPPSMAFCDPGVSGGLEIDCGVHEFDLAHWLFQDTTESVFAMAPPPTRELLNVGDVDTIYGIARLKSGKVLSIDLTRRGGYSDSIRTEVVGTNGSIISDFFESGYVLTRSKELRTFKFKNVIKKALTAQLRSFAEAILRGKMDVNAAHAYDCAIALSAAKALKESRIKGTSVRITSDI